MSKYTAEFIKEVRSKTPATDAWESEAIDSLLDRISQLESEREFWGNEFSAVVAMKDRVAKLEGLLDKVEEELYALPEYIQCMAEDWIEPRGDEDCDYAVALQTSNSIQETLNEIRAVREGETR